MTTTKMRCCSVVLVTFFLVLGVTHQPSAFAQGCLELVGRLPFGPTYAVATSGDYAFFGSGPVLKIADITDPTTPLVVAEIVLPDFVAGLRCRETTSTWRMGRRVCG